MKHAKIVNTFLLATTATLAGCDWMGCENVYESESNIRACNKRVEDGQAEKRAETAQAYREYIRERITPEQIEAREFFTQHLVKFVPTGPESPGYSDYHINELGKSVQKHLSNNDEMHKFLTDDNEFPKQAFNNSDLNLIFKCHEDRGNPIGAYGGERKQDTSAGRTAVKEKINECIVHNKDIEISLNNN